MNKNTSKGIYQKNIVKLWELFNITIRTKYEKCKNTISEYGYRIPKIKEMCHCMNGACVQSSPNLLENSGTFCSGETFYSVFVQYKL
jgi:hypothetical protein